MTRKIQVMIVDDSATVRQTLTRILEGETDIEVISTATDPFVAVRHIKERAPDVIVLDIEMPRMDGLTFLERLMSQHPIPVVICSSLAEHGSESAMAALDRGAVEVISKPKVGTKQFLEESRAIITDAIRSASKVDPRKLRSRPAQVAPKLTADAMLRKPTGRAMVQTTDKVIAIGASTGGTIALERVLSRVHIEAPGIVVVQHMPESFTAQFAARLDSVCAIKVKEAETGDTVLRGQALIAPGGKHLLLQRSGARYFVEVKDGPLVSRHRPSVDVLFRSTARYAGKNGIGIILTGMGDDGAKAMVEMKAAGAYTIAESEESCVVFGMPNEAIKAGGVDKVMDLDRIADEINRLA